MDSTDRDIQTAREIATLTAEMRAGHEASERRFDRLEEVLKERAAGGENCAKLGKECRRKVYAKIRTVETVAATAQTTAEQAKTTATQAKDLATANKTTWLDAAKFALVGLAAYFLGYGGKDAWGAALALIKLKVGWK